MVPFVLFNFHCSKDQDHFVNRHNTQRAQCHQTKLSYYEEIAKTRLGLGVPTRLVRGNTQSQYLQHLECISVRH